MTQTSGMKDSPKDMFTDEAMAWLKADPLTRNIPVIVTTAFSYGPHEFVTVLNRSLDSIRSDTAAN
jgi:response regulator RpfG family c-di-GMP phosphodiesterase